MKVLDSSGLAMQWSITAPEERPAEAPRSVLATPSAAGQSTAAQRARTCLSTTRSGALAVMPLGGDELPAPLVFTVVFAHMGKGEFVVALRRSAFEALGVSHRFAASLSVADTPLSSANTSGAGVSIRGRARRLPPGAEREDALGAYTHVSPADVPAVRRGEVVLLALSPETFSVVDASGELHQVTPEAYDQSEVDPLALVAGGLASHLGSDDSGTLVVLCRAFGGQPGTTAVTMTGIDQFGIDLVASVPTGREPVRINFAKPVTTADEVRRELEAMARGARFKLGVG